MKNFLEYVAEDMLSKYGTNFAHVTVVFPNKRASLFLNDYLVRMAGKTIWSPSYITISDLFCQCSKLKVADPIKQVCDLYQVFTQITGTDETLDHFYGWGQLLLSDFDDIDKNMADADKVFVNLRDLHELDNVDYLTDEQKEVIRKFFSNFSDDHNTELKQRFIRLWSRMGDIYHAFKSHLAKQGLAYEGALYREVATKENLELGNNTYLFIGFNVLQQVEQRLFTTLRKQGKARFYWDFDDYYMKGNEAGHYIAKYQSEFPNELDSQDSQIYGRFTSPKHITYISAATENIQARYIGTWLNDQARLNGGRSTVIVLCNEALLPTVIHSLPNEVDKVNITTGYPLSQSPVAAFIGQLMALQMQGYVINRNQFRLHHVANVLRHPYASCVSELSIDLYKSLSKEHIFYPDGKRLCIDEGTTLLFGTEIGNNQQLLTWICDILQMTARKAKTTDPLFQESIFRAYGLLNRLKSLVECGDLVVDTITLQRLIGQLVSSTSIPFHGEPAEGLQIMGVLETRNLDFDHILLLSCNEGNMPKGVNDVSFIPYSIRKAYGLTTIDHKVSIYSYYFHRLLQRANDITIVYNNSTNEGQTGEMSRFMLQLMVESPHKIQFKTLQAGQHLHHVQLPEIVKSDAVMERLIQRFSVDFHPDSLQRPLLTPTALNRYMRCPIQFYYYYVCDLQEPEEMDDDTVDNRVFGNIFHEAANYIYSRVINLYGQRIKAEHIDNLLHNQIDIERAVDEAFRTQLFQSAALMPLNGLQIISREVIIHYLRLLLQQDRQLAPFNILGLECDVVSPMKIKMGNETLNTSLGGRIDRLDQIIDKDGIERIRVIDYKTSSSRPTPLPDVTAIFDTNYLGRHSDYYLQTFLYASLVRQSSNYNKKRCPVSPAILFVQHSSENPVLRFGKEPIADVADNIHEFGQMLRALTTTIFNPSQPFVPTTDRDRCRNCPYHDICRI